MSRLTLSFALLVVFIFIDDSIQYVASPTCFGQVCPASTTNCEERKKSSADKSRIEIKIICLDDFDASVKDYYFEEPSHLDRYTYYENTRRESINEGISHSPESFQTGPLDLTLYNQKPDYF